MPDADAISIARNMVASVILALTKVINALGEDPAAQGFQTKLELYSDWANALDADDPPNVPSPDQQQPLLAAIQAVDDMINQAAAASDLIVAATNVINTLKAPGI